MKLAIELTPTEEERLAGVAERLSVSIEDLATAAIRDLASKPDDEFERVADHLLAKNRELYERLR